MVGYLKMVTGLRFDMFEEICSPAALGGYLFGDETEAGDTLQRRLFSEAFWLSSFLHIICQGVTNEIDNYTKIVAHRKMAFGYALLNLCINCSIALLSSKI